MAPRIFISSASADDVRSLSDALVVDFEPVSSELTPHPLLTDAEHAVREIRRADALVAVLPPANQSRHVLTEVRHANEQGIPVLLVSRPASAAPPAPFSSLLNVRWTDDITPVVTAVRTVIRHQDRHVAADTDQPALSVGQSRHHAELLRTARGERFERAVTMMLAEVKVELGPPPTVGADLVVWSEELADLLGNPFLIEIKADRFDPDVVEASLGAALGRAGLRAGVVVTGDAFHDAAIVSTADGRTILYLPAVELAETLGGHSLRVAVRQFLDRMLL